MGPRTRRSALRTLGQALILPRMAAPAALGVSLHTGWAVLVAVAGVPGKLEVLLRRRVELLPPGGIIPRFVFHRAAELSSPEAAKLVQRAEAASRELAAIALNEVLEHLRSLDKVVCAMGIAAGSRPVPVDLADVLRSHPMIHTAEGALFRQSIAAACEGGGLAVISVHSREMWVKTAESWKVTEAALRKQIDGLRKSEGAPWGSDEKTATAFALLALKKNSRNPTDDSSRKSSCGPTHPRGQMRQ